MSIAGSVTAGVSAMPLARTGEAAKSGPIGLAVILVLCVACYFLFKSMSKHLRTVREDFPQDKGVARPPADATTNTDADTVARAEIVARPVTEPQAGPDPAAGTPPPERS